MKIDAHLNNQPTIRNIAKLLMNSMYGRFGLRVENIINEIIDLSELNTIMSKYNVISVIPLGQHFLVTYSLLDGVCRRQLFLQDMHLLFSDQSFYKRSHRLLNHLYEVEVIVKFSIF